MTIVAKNTFGNSEPTEMLGVVPTDEPISCLIVNGFDRMAGTNNTFDFIRQHGSALHIAGYSFDSASGRKVDPLYSTDNVPDEIGYPGQFPYTRGIHPNMYRGKLWTMRQFAGFGSPKETNERFKLLIFFFKKYYSKLQ